MSDKRIKELIDWLRERSDLTLDRNRNKRHMVILEDAEKSLNLVEKHYDGYISIEKWGEIVEENVEMKREIAHLKATIQNLLENIEDHNDSVEELRKS